MDLRQALDHAIDLALQAVATGGGGPFGALVVCEGRVIAEAHNEVVTRSDPTAHAEVLAIRRACQTLGTHSLAGCTLVASCEPCPMCLGAIHWARLDALCYAATRADAARGGFDDEAFYEELEKPRQERRLTSQHIEMVRQTEPFVRWAASPLSVRY